MPRYRLAVFDMDGTILDTLSDLKNAVNHILRGAGYPEHSLLEIRSFVGNGSRVLFERALPEGTDAKTVDRLLGDYLPYYRAHCAELTKPYDGIVELLQKIRAKGIMTAVVSNKPEPSVGELCRKYFDGLFDIWAGDVPYRKTKPDPAIVEYVLNKLNVRREDTIYIGDSDVDILTAAASKTDMVAVSWGFKDRDFLIKKGAVVCDTTAQLMEHILA